MPTFLQTLKTGDRAASGKSDRAAKKVKIGGSLTTLKKHHSSGQGDFQNSQKPKETGRVRWVTCGDMRDGTFISVSENTPWEPC
jgi:hypothetical protein